MPPALVNGLHPAVPDFEARQPDENVFQARAVSVDADHADVLCLRVCHDAIDHCRGIFRDEPELIPEFPHFADGRDPAEAVFRMRRNRVERDLDRLDALDSALQFLG